MSHLVSIVTEIRDKAALAAACSRLSLPPPEHGTARLFTTDATGEIVRLPGWTYPVVINTETRQVQFDNFGGAWGKQEEIDKLLQAYAVEKCRIEARKAGHHSVTEQVLSDGSIKVTIQVAGGAV